MTFDELARRTPPEIRARSKRVSVSYEGTTQISKVGAAEVFVVYGEDDNYLAWVSVKGDGRNIMCNCSCPYFTYTLEVSLTRAGASVLLYSNGASPNVRNPRNETYLCKHLYRIWEEYRNEIYGRGG